MTIFEQITDTFKSVTGKNHGKRKLEHVPGELARDPAIVRAAIQQNGAVTQEDREWFCGAVSTAHACLFKGVPEKSEKAHEETLASIMRGEYDGVIVQTQQGLKEFREEREFMVSLAQQGALYPLIALVKRDRELVLAAAQAAPPRQASVEKSDRDIIMEAARQGGFDHEHADTIAAFQAAVAQSTARMLEQVPNVLRRDPFIVRAAIQQSLASKGP